MTFYCGISICSRRCITYASYIITSQTHVSRPARWNYSVEGCHLPTRRRYCNVPDIQTVRVTLYQYVKQASDFHSEAFTSSVRSKCAWALGIGGYYDATFVTRRKMEDMSSRFGPKTVRISNDTREIGPSRDRIATWGCRKWEKPHSLGRRLQNLLGWGTRLPCVFFINSTAIPISPLLLFLLDSPTRALGLLVSRPPPHTQK